LAASDVAQISISTSGPAITRVGYGTPLFADPCLAWGASADRVRTYQQLADLIADGFVVTDGLYKAAAAMLSQPNPPPRFKVGRRANKPTQQWVITPTAQDNTKYVVTVDGQDAVFTSGVGATLAQIIVGLKAAVDALALAVTTTNDGPNVDLKIVANVAGAWHSVRCMRADIPTAMHPQLTVVQNQADPGIAADLAAIAQADGDWYALLLTHTSKAEVLAAAAWVEANGPRVLLADTQDEDTYGGGAGDVMTALKAAGYRNTASIFHPDNGQFAAAGWAGNGLPTNPGAENWKFFTLSGVTGVKLTATQKTNLDGKNGNYYYEVVTGTFITAPGKVASGEWIDVIRFLAWIQTEMQADLLALELKMAAQGKKVPYDDAGIAAAQVVLLAVLQRGVDAGGLAPNPKPTVTVPLASAVSGSDRTARALTGVTFDGQLAGAINFVRVNGVLN
jgi:hypothetical protein